MDYLNAIPHFRDSKEGTAIFLVGCGGTGSYVAPTIARLAKQISHPTKIYFIDPDKVEEKNVGRQNFCYAEIGAYKAESLAARLTAAWGMEIKAIPERWSQTLFSRHRNWQWSNLIIGCVDNAAARKEISACSHSATGWIDAGNSEQAGQVLYGNEDKEFLFHSHNCPNLPLPSLQEPGLLIPSKLTKQKQSCADLIAANIQSLTINQMMGAIVSQYLYSLLCSKPLKHHATYINLETMGTQVSWNTPEALKKYKKTRTSGT